MPSSSTSRDAWAGTSPYLVHEVELGAEEPRLLVGADRELAAAHPAREAQEVADQRRCPRLATERFAFDHQGAQSLGRSVDGRPEARRAGADHDDVELAPQRWALTPRASATSAIDGSISGGRSSTNTPAAAGAGRPVRAAPNHRASRVHGSGA